MPTGGGGGGSVSGWPVAFFQTISNNAASTALGGANQVYITGFYTPSSVIFSNIAFNVNTQDAVNNYDVGIYNQAGTLLAHIGAQTLPTGGNVTVAVVGGAKTITPGLYVFAFTGVAITAKLATDSGPAIIWIRNANVATSSGGALPASIGALTVSVGAFPFGFALF